MLDSLQLPAESGSLSFATNAAQAQGQPGAVAAKTPTRSTEHPNKVPGLNLQHIQQQQEGMRGAAGSVAVSRAGNGPSRAAASSEQQLRAELEDLRRQAHARDQAHAEERERLNKEAAQSRLLCRARARQVAEVERQLAELKQATAAATTSAQQAKDTASKSIADSMLASQRAAQQVQQAQSDMAAMRAELTAAQQACAAATARRDAMEAELRDVKLHMEWQEARMAELENQDETQTVRRYGAELQAVKGRLEQETDETGVKPALGAKRENLLAAARDEILRLKDINSKLLDRGKDLELNHMLRADADAALVAAQQQSRQDLKEAVDRCEAVWAEKLAALEAQCVQLRSELAQACQQNQTLAAGLKADMDNAAAESTERLASLQGKLQVSVEECTKLQAAEAESADQLAASEAALQLSKEECMKLQAALEALKAEVQEQTQTLAAQAAELERVREEADADTAIAMLEASARSEGVSKRMSELKQDLEAAREAAVQEAQEAIQAERSLRLAAEQELAAARSAQSTAPACTDAAVQTDTPAAAARDAQQRSCSPALGSPEEYLQRLPAEESSHGTSPGSAAGPPTGGREDQILAYSSQDRRGGFSRHSDDQALMDHRLTDHHRSQDQPYASSRRRSLARYSDHGSAALTHAELDRRHRSHVAGLSRYPIRDVMPLREAEQLQEMHRRLTADSAAGSAQRNTLSSSYHGNVLAGPAYDSYPEAMRHRSIEDARTPIKAHTLRLHSTSPDPPLSSSHSRRRSSHSSYDPVTRDRNGAGGSPGGSLAAAQLRLDCLEARVQQPLVEDQDRRGSAVHEALPGSGPYPSTEPRLLVGLGGLGPQEADEDDLCRMASENGTGTPESSFATARQPHGSVSGSSHSSGRQAVYRPQYASSPIYHPRAHQTSTFVGSMASPHPSGIPASHHTPVSAPLRKPLGSERSYSPHTDRRLGFHNHPDAADPAAPDAMRRALHASAAREMFPEGSAYSSASSLLWSHQSAAQDLATDALRASQLHMERSRLQEAKAKQQAASAAIPGAAARLGTSSPWDSAWERQRAPLASYTAAKDATYRPKDAFGGPAGEYK
ncbi:hypothetical protein WJX72_008447 [[Myrmecia] bisecta]|uniref:Uncharacterized protein n=1 Tax=[Myrmecia] bisecta TaxID=41462 RepID=A0AAW1PWS1_9CHLO